MISSRQAIALPHFDISDWRQRGFWIALDGWIVFFALLALGSGLLGWSSSGSRFLFGAIGLGMLLVAASFAFVVADIARTGPLERQVDILLGRSWIWKLGLYALALFSFALGAIASGSLDDAERDRDLKAAEQLRYVQTVSEDVFSEAPDEWRAFTDGVVSAELLPDRRFQVRISAAENMTTVWPHFRTTPGAARFSVNVEPVGEGWFGLFCHRHFSTTEPGESTFFAFQVHTSGRYRIAARFAGADDQIFAEGPVDLVAGGTHTLAAECVERIGGGPVVLSLAVDGTTIVRHWRGAGIGGAGYFGVIAGATSDDFQVRFARLRIEEVAYPD